MENINFNLEITYDNDDEYQECLKQVYNINTINYVSYFQLLTKDFLNHRGHLSCAGALLLRSQ